MSSFEREKFDNFVNLNFDEIIENFEQSPDITDEKNYWFFDNVKQDVLFISYYDPNKLKNFKLVKKDDEVSIEQNITSISIKASFYFGLIMYENGYPLLLLNANPKNLTKKNGSNYYDLATALEKFIDDNPDFDLDETKLILFLFNEKRDYYTTNIKLPSKYRSIMKELKLQEVVIDSSEYDYLSEQYRVPSINLSIGFYDFGKSNERINYLDLEDMIKIAFAITEAIESVDKESIQFEEPEEDEFYDEDFEEEEEYDEDYDEDDEDEEDEGYEDDYDDEDY